MRSYFKNFNFTFEPTLAGEKNIIFIFAFPYHFNKQNVTIELLYGINLFKI